MSRFTLKQLLPKGPVLSPARRRALFEAPRPSGAHYEGLPRHPAPLLPLMPFGIAYDLDLVVVTKHPDWDMHELARVQTPEGPLWFAKDARSDTLEQSIVSAIPNLSSWLPELPVPRKSSPVEVIDQSSDTRLDLKIAWQNPRGENTALHYIGSPPRSLQRKRNGSTMGHSRQTLLAALDLSHRDWATQASVTYDGRPMPLQRLFLIKPFAMALQQTQGGFLTGSFRQRVEGSDLVVTHRRDGHEWPQRFRIHREGGITTLTQEDPMRTLHFRYLTDQGALELFEIQVSQFGRREAPMRALFSPALPDLRRALSRPHTSHWVLDINGQESHAIGDTLTQWRDGAAEVSIRPTRPWWVADRPMQITARCDADSGEASVAVKRSCQGP